MRDNRPLSRYSSASLQIYFASISFDLLGKLKKWRVHTRISTQIRSVETSEVNVESVSVFFNDEALPGTDVCLEIYLRSISARVTSEVGSMDRSQSFWLRAT